MINLLPFTHMNKNHLNPPSHCNFNKIYDSRWALCTFGFWALDHCTASALPLVSAFRPSLFFFCYPAHTIVIHVVPAEKVCGHFREKNLTMCLRQILEKDIISSVTKTSSRRLWHWKNITSPSLINLTMAHWTTGRTQSNISLCLWREEWRWIWKQG